MAAGWVGVSQSRLSRIENGEPLTDLAKLTRWARMLGLPPELRWFQGPGTNSPAAALPDLTQSDAFQLTGSVLLPVVVNGQPVLIPLNASSLASRDRSRLGTLVTSMGEWDGMSPMKRRAFLGGHPVAGLSALGLDELERVALALTDAGKYLDASVVGYFRRQLAACAADDGALGPQKTLPAVLGVVGGRAARPRGQAVCPPSAIAGRARKARSSRVGSTAMSATRPKPPTGGTGRPIGAQEAGDMAMQGYVLLKKSQAAYDERDATRMLTWPKPSRVGRGTCRPRSGRKPPSRRRAATPCSAATLEQWKPSSTKRNSC